MPMTQSRETLHRGSGVQLAQAASLPAVPAGFILAFLGVGGAAMAAPPPLSEIVETPIEQSPEQTPPTPNISNTPVANYGPEFHRTADRANAVRRPWTIGVSQ